MFKKFLIIIFILNISLAYSKEETVTFVCLPPEGTMDAKEMASYVSAVEAAFIKAGYNVADMQIMKEMESKSEEATTKAGKSKVDYFVGVILDNWEEEKLDNASMKSDRKKEIFKAKEEYMVTYEYTKITLKVVEAETSMVVAQGNVQDYSFGDKKVIPWELSTKAVNKVMKDVKKQLKKKKR